MNFSQVFEYYSRDDVQNALLGVSASREVSGILRDGKFGSRPNMLAYKNDIGQMVRSNSVSFHGSVERWSNPMSLAAGMKRQDLDKLRTGFDLLLDLDFKVFDHAKIAAKIFIDALKKHGVKSIFLKYTGGKSFHIAVPFESFPETVNYRPTRLQYPEIPETIVKYLNGFVRHKLEREIFRIEPDIEELANKLNVPLNELLREERFEIGLFGSNQTKSVQIKMLPESGLFSSRHLFRLPYSLHESSFLASVPLKISDIDGFKKEDAAPDKVKVKEKFLFDVQKSDADAAGLVIEALDWAAKETKPEPLRSKPVFTEKSVITKEFFPPCIMKILGGMSDGRKRSLFILINFLRNMNWSMDRIEEEVNEWNQRNTQPLPATYLRGQV
ncbi:MAG: hypothetical protein V1731_03200, partial [Candidatus Aenigmatarchaeota archaeon]